LTDANRNAGFEILLQDDPRTVLYAERLRDGRIALGTRVQQGDGSWNAGELLLLDPRAYLGLAAWLSSAVEEAWTDTVRDRGEDSLRTAHDLYGEGAAAVERLAGETIHELPPALMTRALILMINSIGPEARERLVARLNRTPSASEDAALRRRLAEENEAFAYGVAAAALFDALERGEGD
jgi:hypothetical protein